MKYKSIIIALLVCFSFTVQADEIETSYIKVLEAMESNFASLNSVKPFEEGKYQNFYNNTLVDIPDAKDSYFVESKISGQRYLSIKLDFDLNTAEGKKACELFRMRFFSFQPYLFDKYNHHTENEQYSIKKEDVFIGAISYKVKDGKAALKFYAYNGNAFFSTLNQVVVEGVANKFEPYIGEKAEGLADIQYMSKLKVYRDSYSIYSKHPNAVSHQSFYQHWPPSMFFQLFGKDSSIFKKAMGSNYKVNSYEYDAEQNSILINITYDGKTVLIQVLEKDDTQIVGVAIG